jgi:hypothetical protein
MSEAQSPANTFTDVEEAFFEAGIQMSELESIDSFADLDRDFERPSLWSRLFSRTQDA